MLLNEIEVIKVLFAEQNGKLDIFDMRTGTSELQLYTSREILKVLEIVLITTQDVDWSTLDSSQIGAVSGNGIYIWNIRNENNNLEILQFEKADKMKWSKTEKSTFAVSDSLETLSIINNSAAPINIPLPSNCRYENVAWAANSPHILTAQGKEIHYFHYHKEQTK